MDIPTPAAELKVGDLVAHPSIRGTHRRVVAVHRVIAQEVVLMVRVHYAGDGVPDVKYPRSLVGVRQPRTSTAALAIDDLANRIGRGFRAGRDLAGVS